MRVSAGPPQNLDWLYEIRNSRAFVRTVNLTASVGNFSEIQLLNPAGSAVVVFVYQIQMAVTATTPVQVRTHNTALGTLSGNGVNLNLGAAASVAEVRTDQPAAEDGTGILAPLVDANIMRDLTPEWFTILTAGEGFLTTPDGTNLANRTTFLWVER